MPSRLASYIRSHHVALLALFLALGGTSYAAATLPKDSVGTTQIKDGQVQKADLAKSALPSASAPVRSGETIRGVLGSEGQSPQPNSQFSDAVSFQAPAPTAVDSDHIDVDTLEESEDRCAGSATNPTAPKGVVCIYLTSHSGAQDVAGVGAPGFEGSRYGFALTWTAQSGDHAISGTWAYTGQ